MASGTCASSGRRRCAMCSATKACSSSASWCRWAIRCSSSCDLQQRGGERGGYGDCGPEPQPQLPRVYPRLRCLSRCQGHLLLQQSRRGEAAGAEAGGARNHLYSCRLRHPIEPRRTGTCGRLLRHESDAYLQGDLPDGTECGEPYQLRAFRFRKVEDSRIETMSLLPIHWNSMKCRYSTPPADTATPSCQACWCSSCSKPCCWASEWRQEPRESSTETAN